MDHPMDIDEDLGDEGANAEALIDPEAIDDDDEVQDIRSEADDDHDGDNRRMMPDLRSLGSKFRSIGVRYIFKYFECEIEEAAVIILYLLYPDLSDDIIGELRDWFLSGERIEMWRIEAMFDSLGSLGVTEQIEQDHAERLLEFVDVVGALMRGARRKFPEGSLNLSEFKVSLHGPLGLAVAAKLLQHAQSVESIEELTLSCDYQYRAFRPDEVELLVTSILNLKQLSKLFAEIDTEGDLLVDLCAGLKYHENLSYLRVNYPEHAHQLPNEIHLIRNIQQIVSLETLHLSGTFSGESTVNLFSSEASYTKLHLHTCRLLVGGDDGNDPSELPLAEALASNRRLEALSFEYVRGSLQFFQGIEQGLLRNRTLQKLKVSSPPGPEHNRIPEFALIGWIQSIRFHPSLRMLDFYMPTWSTRLTDAVCSMVRDNTSLDSIALSCYEGSEWIGDVFQALQGNRTIVDVRFSAVSSEYDDRNWVRLAELLTANDSIRSINFNAGRKSIPERLLALLQRVKSNRILHRLGVEDAVFRKCHTRALVELLSDNYVLASLAPSPNGYDRQGRSREQDPIYCSDEGSKRLLKGILDLNYYGRRYMRTQPNSVSHGVALLSNVSSNLDAVYFHLGENPRLCDRREWT